MRYASAAVRARMRPRLVVRRSWWAYLPVLVVLATGAAFCGGIAWEMADVPIVRSISVLVSASFVGVASVVVRRTLLLLDEANWVVLVTDDALVLNPIDVAGRTYTEPVEVPFVEIRAVRHTPTGDVEVALADVDCGPLVGFPPPIVLERLRTLRIGWRDGAVRLTPPLATMLAALPAVADDGAHPRPCETSHNSPLDSGDWRRSSYALD